MSGSPAELHPFCVPIRPGAGVMRTRKPALDVLGTDHARHGRDAYTEALRRRRLAVSRRGPGRCSGCGGTGSSGPTLLESAQPGVLLRAEGRLDPAGALVADEVEVHAARSSTASSRRRSSRVYAMLLVGVGRVGPHRQVVDVARARCAGRTPSRRSSTRADRAAARDEDHLGERRHRRRSRARRACRSPRRAARRGSRRSSSSACPSGCGAVEQLLHRDVRHRRRSCRCPAGRTRAAAANAASPSSTGPA